MNVNFFEWLRSSVRQSVLLGVSDAVEQIGVPSDSDELHPSVAAFLTGDGTTKAKRVSQAATSKTGSRKRLGKSLREMDTATSK